MHIDFITFSKRGAGVALSLRQGLMLRGHVPEIFSYSRQAIGPCIPFSDLAEQAEQCYRDADAIVFVTNASVAVRTIAPLLLSDIPDPSVCVLDEDVEYCISLTSGKVGGANILTKILSEISGAEPVITRTKLAGEYFDVEKFIKQNSLHCDNKKLLKEIGSSLIAGDTVGLNTEFAHGDLPEGLDESTVWPVPELGISITYTKANPAFRRTLILVPKCVTIGISCKKGTPKQKIEDHIFMLLTEYRIPLSAVCEVTSVYFKKDEQGIKEFCEEYKIPFDVFTPEEIANTVVKFKEGEYVKVTGDIPSVCERCAVTASRGKLIVKRHVSDGISLALALKNIYIEF